MQKSGGLNGHIIEDDNQSYPQRGLLRFKGAVVTDNVADMQSIIVISLTLYNVNKYKPHLRIPRNNY
jgi:hypothetical protein